MRGGGLRERTAGEVTRTVLKGAYRAESDAGTALKGAYRAGSDAGTALKGAYRAESDAGGSEGKRTARKVTRGRL